MRVTFLGAAGTVTGSKYLVEGEHGRILVDCGLFQGLKQWRLQNREPLPVAPSSIDAVLLTHAHLDHSGYLPILVRDGFRGPIYSTGATRELCGVILPDSGRLQEEDAAYANRHGFSRHKPAQPLYTEVDAARSLDAFATVPLETSMRVADGINATFSLAGHILGAAMIAVECDGTRILFSGDLGRPDDALVHPPALPRAADYIVVESTYGNRRHPGSDAGAELAQVITQTAARGGTVIIPAFAVARAQTLIYVLHEMQRAGRIPDIPIIFDTPMGELANAVFLRHAGELAIAPAHFAEALTNIRVTSTVQQSKQADAMSFPRVIISASGMATGGRVLHHLAALAPDPRNAIVLVGFQVAGTRGADLRAGVQSIRIHGRDVPVRARLVSIDGFSSHADYAQILDWLGAAPQAPRKVFITHGEPESADALRRHIDRRFGWACHVPYYREQVTLPAADVVAPVQVLIGAP